MLGFIEFDDQGQLWNRDPKSRDVAGSQLQTVLRAVESLTNEGADDYLMIVFVHGWHNNASPGNGNVASFRSALEQMSETELKITEKINASSTHKVRPRKVIGIYLGWRGESFSLPGVNMLSFYDRKNTAEKVGHGEVTEVLKSLEQLREHRLLKDPETRSRLVIIGHSFGGAVVFTALQQILEGRLLEALNEGASEESVQGIGNLVVLVNPAFEAQLYAPLRDLSAERSSYAKKQLPVMAVLTSESDGATGFWFPFGRWFSTRFEKERIVTRVNPASGKTEHIDQHETNLYTVGHFAPFATHRLDSKSTPKTQSPDMAKSQTDQDLAILARASAAWEDDKPGSKIDFPGCTLTRSPTSVGRDPYMVVSVDGALIRDHNDIWNQDIRSFVSDLILLSTQSSDLAVRSEHREALNQ